TIYRVSYVLEGTELHRILCQGGSPADQIVAHNVVSIDGPTCTAAGSSIACTGTASDPVPDTVSLTLHIQVTGSTDQPLVVTLTGQRRQTCPDPGDRGPTWCHWASCGAAAGSSAPATAVRR